MKWIGGALLVLCGMLLGMGKITAMRREIGQISEIVGWIGCVQREVRQRNAPLPEILFHQTSACIPDFSDRLRQGVPLAQAARSWLARQPRETASILAELFSVLGRYDGETQALACTAAVERLTRQQNVLRCQLSEKSAVYQTVPVVLSLLAALVLS